MQRKKFYLIRNLLFFFNIFIGLVYIFIIPPFQSPDEFNHYIRTKIILTNNEIKKQNYRLGGNICKEDIDFLNQYGFLINSKNEKLDHFPWEHKSTDLKNCEMIFSDFPNTALYSFILYLPQSLGNFLFLHHNQYVSYISGKIVLFIFYIFCAFFLIRKLSHVSQITVIIFLLYPVNIMISTSYNADTINNIASIAILGLYFRDNKYLSLWEIFLSIFATIIISIGKLSSIPLILFFLHFRLKKNSLIMCLSYIALILLITISSFGYLYLNSKNLYIPHRNYNLNFLQGQPLLPNVYPELQILFIFQEPFNFIINLIQSFTLNIISIFQSSIGVMGWLEWKIPVYKSIFLLIFMITPMLFEIERFKFYKLNKQYLKFILSFVVFLGLIFIFMTIMYITWTPVGVSYVNNLQGRYFFVAFLVFILTVSKIFYFKINKVWIYSLLLFAFIHASIVLNILFRYYSFYPKWMAF